MRKSYLWGAVLLFGLLFVASAGNRALTTSTYLAPLPSATLSMPEVRVVPVATGLFWPTDIAHAGDARLFVAEKAGRIVVVQPDGTVEQTPFLDIRERVLSVGYEQGLLGLVFHPQYAENGTFYVSYTRHLGAAGEGVGDTVVSRFQVPGGATVADPASETVLLTVEQPSEFHNGGDLAFGPDGYLYIARGDGSLPGLPSDDAQDRETLLGKILRIDVNRTEGETPYALPPDNPYIGDADARGEIWASGLRNPWRISFDRETGELYIADVGDFQWEEVNFQPAGSTGGENYGWPLMEGSECYVPEETACNPGTLTLPVMEYEHGSGAASVTGGFVYRGSRYPALQGYYFYIDYYAQRLWSLRRNEAGEWQSEALMAVPDPITTFGEGADGELYLAGDDWAEENPGNLYQIQDARE
ncbi:MAG TPA: PQQ-dependent sugar dehydrogenase [Ardenticatenaceae bacterium]